MALLTDNGFESTYLASNLRDQGLVTPEEHDSRRARILDSM